MKNSIRIEHAVKNITQAELAELINVSRQSVIAIESAKYIPSTVLAIKIANVFNKNVEDIFILEDND